MSYDGGRQDGDGARRIAIYGTDEVPPEARLLRAGPLSARLEGGALRHLRHGGLEIIRGIAFLVRDANWGTLPANIAALQFDEGPDGFALSYEGRVDAGEGALVYRARIEGRADGTLRFDASGHAEGPVQTNRAGFVVLHPLEGVVGRPVRVEHSDGTVEESAFPEPIDPACPFTDIRALTHQPVPGVTVACRMEGDAYEMEDHRNWLDASFKTYIRPLARPWPYILADGERVEQSVSITVSGPPSAIVRSDAAVTVTLGDPTENVVPRVGLAAPAEHLGEAMAHTEAPRAAGAGFLVCPFDPRRGHDAKTAAAFGALGERLSLPLVLEAVVPCLDASGAPTDDPAILARDMAAIADAARGVAWERVAVSPAADLKSTTPGATFPPAPGWEDLIGAARKVFTDIPVGGGMFSYFTELNRKRPPRGLLDFVCHSGAPIVHAGDDQSVVETLEAVPWVFRSTRDFMADTPYWILPTAISMRMNPYGTDPVENPANIRQAMNRADPRDRGLLGAAWYLGYLAQAAEAGLEAVTLGAVGGPSAIVGGAGGQSTAGYPTFHAVAWAAALSGHPVVECRSSSKDVAAFAARTGDGPTVLCANLTPRTVPLRLKGPLADSQVSVVDGFASVQSEGPSRPEPGDLKLEPFALARVGAHGRTV